MLAVARASDEVLGRHDLLTGTGSEAAPCTANGGVSGSVTDPLPKQPPRARVELGRPLPAAVHADVHHGGRVGEAEQHLFTARGVKRRRERRGAPRCAGVVGGSEGR